MIARNYKLNNRPARRKYKSKVRFGVLKGKIRYPDDFDAPLPPTVLALFNGRRGKCGRSPALILLTRDAKLASYGSMVRVI